MGRDRALMVAALVIPDRCVYEVRKNNEPEVTTRLLAICTLLDVKLSNMGPGTTNTDRKLARTADEALEAYAKTYRVLPSQVVTREGPVNCAPPWLRSFLVPWLLSVSFDLIDEALALGTRELQRRLENIFDWVCADLGQANLHVLEALSYAEAEEAAIRWHQGLAQKRLDGPAPPAKRVLYTWEDGFKLYELRTAEELAAEGAHMGHCVGAYMLDDILAGRMQILSLRDSAGRPKITLELGQAHDRDVDDSPIMAVVQAKGPRNAKPSDRHAFRIAAWLLAVGCENEYAVTSEDLEWDFEAGDEYLASHAETLQVAAKLLAAPLGTRMDLESGATDRDFIFRPVWLEARAGKRPVLNAQVPPRGFTSARVDAFQDEFKVQRLLHREVLTAQQIPWVDIGGEWKGDNVQMVFRTVCPPSVQEVATILLKLRRCSVFTPAMWHAQEALLARAKEIRESSRGGRPSARVERLFREARALSSSPLPTSWPPGGAGLRNRR